MAGQDFGSLPELCGRPACRKVFKYSILIWNESKILMRVMYKSKNQLRNWKPFKKIVEVQRYLKRIAIAESWLNSAPLETEADFREYLGYMEALDRLIDASRTVCQSAYFHQNETLSKGLFVQVSLTAVSCISRMDYCLAKVKDELVREINKALLKITDHTIRFSIIESMNLQRFVKQEDATGPDEIIVVSDMKEGKRPPPKLSGPTNNFKKPKVTPQGPSPTKKGDEIDDIFGF